MNEWPIESGEPHVERVEGRARSDEDNFKVQTLGCWAETCKVVRRHICTWYHIFILETGQAFKTQIKLNKRFFKFMKKPKGDKLPLPKCYKRNSR